LLEAVVELFSSLVNTQVVDSRKREKRQNRYVRRTGVHGRYADYEFVSNCALCGRQMAI